MNVGIFFWAAGRCPTRRSVRSPTRRHHRTILPSHWRTDISRTRSGGRSNGGAASAVYRPVSHDPKSFPNSKMSESTGKRREVRNEATGQSSIRSRLESQTIMASGVQAAPFGCPEWAPVHIRVAVESLRVVHIGAAAIGVGRDPAAEGGGVLPEHAWSSPDSESRSRPAYRFSLGVRPQVSPSP